MKILLSWLRDFVDIPVDGHTLARDLTMRGFEVASIDRVPASNDDDELLLDLEITANRPDCLSVVGIAREVLIGRGVPHPHVIRHHQYDVGVFGEKSAEAKGDGK